jgi:hypothetical protein
MGAGAVVVKKDQGHVGCSLSYSELLFRDEQSGQFSPNIWNLLSESVQYGIMIESQPQGFVPRSFSLSGQLN